MIPVVKLNLSCQSKTPKNISMISNIIKYRNFLIFYLLEFKFNKSSHLIVCRLIKCLMIIEMNVEMNFSWDNVSRIFVMYDLFVQYHI